MTKEEFLIKLKETLHTQTDLSPQMELGHIDEWDSLSKLEVQVFLDECGKKVSYADLDQLKTVADIMAYVDLEN